MEEPPKTIDLDVLKQASYPPYQLTKWDDFRLCDDILINKYRTVEELLIGAKIARDYYQTSTNFDDKYGGMCSYLHYIRLLKAAIDDGCTEARDMIIETKAYINKRSVHCILETEFLRLVDIVYEIK